MERIIGILKEFFGFGGYQREPEGYMTWQHLTYASVFMVIMLVCAIYLGIKYSKKSNKEKNKVLIFSAIAINVFEITRIIVLCWRGNNPMGWINQLPLFLCSIQFITIPLAAFSKGRVKEAALDFVTIFGILGAVMGTYFAGQNYGCYPLFSMDNIVSGITHCMSGFTALYIMISGMISMKKKNMWITLTILGGFAIAAYIANIYTDANYMFLSRGDGTPYTLLENLFNDVFGSKIASIVYPLSVIALFVLYITVFYSVYFAILKNLEKKHGSTAKA